MKEKINQTAGRLKQTVRAAGAGIATLAASFFMSAPAYAAGVQDSQIVKGTEKLVGDVTTWLMVLAPVVAGLLKKLPYPFGVILPQPASLVTAGWEACGTTWES